MKPIELRKARPEDKTAVSTLAAKIWEGEDYLGQRFDKWVADEHGRFTVAYSGEALVACGKLTRFGPGEWWLEGLRVDPDWRGKGIARIMHEDVINYAIDQKLPGHLRLATDSENVAIHKLSFDTSFSHISRHLLYKATVPTEAIDSLPFTQVETAEKSSVESWFNRSAVFTASFGLFEDTWKWYEIRPRLDEVLANGRLHWWHKSDSHDQPAAGLIILNHRDPETLVLNYLDAPNGRYAALLQDVRQLGQTYNVQQIKSKPLATAEIKQAFPDSLWEIDYDLEMWVFERPLG